MHAAHAGNLNSALAGLFSGHACDRDLTFFLMPGLWVKLEVEVRLVYVSKIWFAASLIDDTGG